MEEVEAVEILEISLQEEVLLGDLEEVPSVAVEQEEAGKEKLLHRLIQGSWEWRTSRIRSCSKPLPIK